jgi:hypothetical protein
MENSHAIILAEENKDALILTRCGHLCVWCESHQEWNTIMMWKGIHVSVWVLRFFGPLKPSKKHMCCHKDDNRSHNHIDNLYWGTAVDNASDAKRNGKVKRRERSRWRKL